ncbi:MAG TPA: dihydrodipicolinate synthase family protein [Myxococcales bacterium LLY-WYZ-16_1]|nr:dihydrodipicolinate synthase family protein [Myxococcales bacterium LLY-WYZ-16_1]
MSEDGDRIPLYVALPTPFDEKGQPDGAALERLCAYFQERSIDGVVAFHDGGEDTQLTPEDRRLILERITKRIGAPKEVWVTVRSPWTRGAVDEIRHAEQMGAAAILLALPLVPGIGYAEAYRHVERAARATKLPLHLWVSPLSALSVLAAEELDVVAEPEGVQGVVLGEASPGIAEAWSRRFGSRERRVWWPCAFSFDEGFRAGANGVVCGLSALGAEQAVRFVTAVARREEKTVRSGRKKFKPLVELLGPPRFDEEPDALQRWAAWLARRPLDGGVVAPPVPFRMIKEGLRLQGHGLRSWVRPPFGPVSDTERERLQAVLRSAGLLS